MAKSFKKLSNEELLAKLDEHLKGGILYSDDTLAKERQEVLDYYNGKLPAPLHKGSSKYVSMDVYDTVESAKAVLLETFAAGSDIAEFEAQGEVDVEMARIASEYTDYVLFRQNNGFEVFNDIIHNGLTSRVGVAKVYWDEKWHDEEETFDGITQDDLDKFLMENEDVYLKEGEDPVLDPVSMTLSGTIVRRINCSKVCVEVIPPEEFIISSNAVTIKDSPFHAHRVKKTVSDLVAMGLTLEEAREVPNDGLVITDTEKQARLNNISSSMSLEQEIQEQAREVTIYECYAKMDLDGSGEVKLWKVLKAGKHILGKPQAVRASPFVAYIPLPIPHSFYGVNFAQKVIPIQNARTVLMRGILDHTVITNNPRYMVVKGALQNPREMVENRIGGLVNVTRPDGLAPLMQPNLNPFVFQTIQLLDEDKEDTTGISKLSQGLNKDAVSKQNSQGMVEQLVTLSQQRQKIIARNFANNFLVPLYLEIYQIVVENETQDKIVELAGNWVEVKPYTWAERKHVKVNLKLGYGEREREAQKWIGLHQLNSQDPVLSRGYDYEQAFATVGNYYKSLGVKNLSAFLKPPDQVPPPQPPPELMAQVELLKAQAESLKAKNDLAAAQLELKKSMDDMKMSFDKSMEMIKLMSAQREQERKDFEARSRHDIANREMDILEKTKPTETKQTQIVSPG